MVDSAGTSAAAVGLAAARALVALVVAEGRSRAQDVYRHRSRPVTKGSLPLPQRFLNDAQNLPGGFRDNLD